ncbi:MAG: tetratricopeptide repeat protein, partial [Treponema sp.]|nr:tetratricopeptide repeat protein [Treponema sp.]
DLPVPERAGGADSASSAEGAAFAEDGAGRNRGGSGAPPPAAGEEAGAPDGTDAQGPETPPPALPAAGNRPPEIPAELPPGDYLGRAREEFEAGRVASAISVLDQFREHYPSGSDEAYWLYGQFYEANSPGRDILTALDYYRRLIREYPQSSRCNEARRRIAYLERYYINIH